MFIEIVKILNKKQKEISDIHRGEETGPYFSYDIIDNNTIIAEFGWMSYEEGESIISNIIVLDDSIKINTNKEGSCVMCGNYSDNEQTILTTIEEFDKWVDENT